MGRRASVRDKRKVQRSIELYVWLSNSSSSSCVVEFTCVLYMCSMGQMMASNFNSGVNVTYLPTLGIHLLPCSTGRRLYMRHLTRALLGDN